MEKTQRNNPQAVAEDDVMFALAKMRLMRQTGRRGFRSWLFILEGQDGKVYKTFHPISAPPLMICDNAIIVGRKVKTEIYLGEEQVVFKNASILKPEAATDTEETEAEAYGDNIAQHRQDNPFWWVVEGREELIEGQPVSVMVAQAGEPLSPSGLTADQEQAAWAEFYGEYDYTHPSETR